jgi:hypothetical protein
MRQTSHPPANAATLDRPTRTPTRRAAPVGRLAAFLSVVVVALAAAAAARAEIIVSRDNAGRPITFDVRAAGTDVEWYAGLLRAAAHGDEIALVTIRIVPEEEIAAQCGAAAAACYGPRAGRGTIVVPTGRDDRLARILLHEYGHHLDRAWAVGGVSEPNGTPGWWARRGIADLLNGGLVAFDYSLGWSRSVAEIFAEDYAQIQVGGAYEIRWLPPPDDALRSALLAELSTSPPAPPATTAPAPLPEPLVIERRGRLAPRARRTLPFELLGPGRRVTFTATVGGEQRAGSRARLELVCDDSRVATRTLGRGQRSRTLDVRGLGPARCQVAVASTSRSSLSYVLRLRLAVEAQRKAA